VLQRHLNSAVKKVARITARDAPSDEAMHAAMEQRRRAAALGRRSLPIAGTSEDEHPMPRSPSPSRRAHHKRSPQPATFAAGRHGRIGVVIPQKEQGTPERRLLGALGGLLNDEHPDLASATLIGPPVAAQTGTSAHSYATKKKSNKAAATPDGSGGFPKSAWAAANSGGVQKAKAPTAKDSLGLDIEANDVGYVATVQIGSASTPFRLLIDSGSADTWVPSTACDNCSDQHQRLGKKISSSFRGSQKPFSITYGTGSVSGILAQDRLMIAGLKLSNHTIGLAHKESSDFSDPSVPFDGLMGLAQQKLANSRSPTPIDALYAARLVSAPVMGYHLARAADSNNDGEVTFGGVDASKFKGQLVEVPNVSTQGFWEIKLDGVKFGGKTIASLSKGRTAILDTGTTLIVAPQADADAVHRAIPGAKSDGQGGYTIPCTTTGAVTFSFGGREWPMTPNDMKFLPVDSQNLKGDCISSISAGDVGQANEWLVGAAFLRNIYLATNTKSNSVGLGALA
jgi:hypothetical protein